MADYRAGGKQRGESPASLAAPRGAAQSPGFAIGSPLRLPASPAYSAASVVSPMPSVLTLSTPAVTPAATPVVATTAALTLRAEPSPALNFSQSASPVFVADARTVPVLVEPASARASSAASFHSAGSASSALFAAPGTPQRSADTLLREGLVRGTSGDDVLSGSRLPAVVLPSSAYHAGISPGSVSSPKLPAGLRAARATDSPRSQQCGLDGSPLLSRSSSRTGIVVRK